MHKQKKSSEDTVQPVGHTHACTPDAHECTGACHDRAENCPECIEAGKTCACGSDGGSCNHESGQCESCGCESGGCESGQSCESCQHSEICQNCSELTAKLERAQDKERRALADYQNLVRRTQADSARFAKFATRELVAQLVQPLEHLKLASEQVKDPGLEMVLTQLWQVLEQNGVSVVDPLGKEFSVDTMEAVEQLGEGTQVTQVVTRGYLLNGEVLQHAKVIVGAKK
jgi:molecular chaperone GrpE